MLWVGIAGTNDEWGENVASSEDDGRTARYARSTRGTCEVTTPVRRCTAIGRGPGGDRTVCTVPARG